LTVGGGFRSAIVDISRGGIALRSEKSPQLGEFVRLRFGVPRFGAVLWVNPDAVVIRSTPFGRSMLWALQFVRLHNDYCNAITRYVEIKQAKASNDYLRDLQARVAAPTAETPRAVTGSFDRVDPAELRGPRPAGTSAARERFDRYRAAIADIYGLTDPKKKR
jgi:hypothetical protein